MSKAPKMAKMPRMKSPARQAAGKNQHALQSAKAATKAATRKATAMRK